MSENMKLLDLFCEYRTNIRCISVIAEKEKWTDEKLQIEIEGETEKIDKILYAYQVINKYKKT